VDLIDVVSWRTPAARADLVLATGERFVAGGTFLYSEPQPATTGLVDLTALGWAPWEELPDGGLRIAATCTIAELQQAPWPLPGTAALVRQCADALLMSWKVQYAATVGGNIALGLPAGAMTSLFAGLGATALIWGPTGERTLPCSDLVTGVAATALAPGEVIRALDVPPASLTARTAFRRIALTDLGRSAAVVVGRTTLDGLVLTLTAATPAPVVVPARSVAEVAAGVAAVERWHDDAHGAPDWRAAVTARLAAEVAEELSAERGGR
jgi:CO/xanthine dehydrogenase FAD-binding subunit